MVLFVSSSILDGDDIRLLCDFLSDVLSSGCAYGCGALRSLVSNGQFEDRLRVVTGILSNVAPSSSTSGGPRPRGGARDRLAFNQDQKVAVLEVATVFLKLVRLSLFSAV